MPGYSKWTDSSTTVKAQTNGLRETIVTGVLTFSVSFQYGKSPFKIQAAVKKQPLVSKLEEVIALLNYDLSLLFPGFLENAFSISPISKTRSSKN